jgi:signal transduction histidine kinase
MIPVVLMPPAFLHFASALSGQFRQRIIHFSNYVAAAMIILTIYTQIFSPGVASYDVFPFWLIPGPTFHLHVLHMLVSVILGLWLIANAARKSEKHYRIRLWWVFWAYVGGFLSGWTNYLAWYRLFPPLLNPLVALHFAAICYAIIRHQLLDIHLVIRRSLIYSILITLLTVGYFGIIHLAEWIFKTTIGYQSVGMSVLAFATMAVIFQPLRARVQAFVEQVLFGQSRDALISRLEQLEAQVDQAQKHRAVAVLAAGMAHEIKNPLTAIKTFTEYFPEKVDDAAFRKKFHRILTQEVQKIELVVRQLLDFSKPAALELQPVQVPTLLDETLELISHEGLRRHLVIERSYRDHDAVSGDPRQLRQVFLNLFLNSFEAMSDGGTLTVSTWKEENQLCVTIEDTGKGMSKAELKRLCEPHFTTKANGNGLGLSVVRNMIAAHHGTMSFDSHLGLGTRCALRFPLSAVTPQTNPCSQTSHKGEG